MEGNQVWNTSNTSWLSSLAYETFSVLEITISDDNFIYTATDRSVIKWDKLGNLIWNTTLEDSSAYYQLYGVVSDGNAVYTLGKVRPFRLFVYDIVLVKWDTEGNQIWLKSWNGPVVKQGLLISSSKISRASKLITDGEGHIYVIGETNGEGGEERDDISDLLLMKWSETGELIGLKIANVTYDDEGFDLVIGNDKNIYCIGNGNDYMNQHLIIMVFSPEGFNIPSPEVASGLEMPLTVLAVILLATFFHRKRKK